MTASELLDLFEYNRWAHEHTLEAARELSGEQYGRTLPGSFPSLRATLEHLLAVEVVWLSRWEGHSLGEPPNFSGLTGVASLTRLWNSLWKRQFNFLVSLSDDELTRPIAIRTRSGIETVQPLGETMLHVVNHSSYHRGQAVNFIRQLGGIAQNTDYFTYCVTRGSQAVETD
jgi:uncharacterized damage-inducible protein DinB